MPSVLPRSSVPRKRFFSHLPSFIARSAAGTDPRERQHQRAGVLGDADAVGARRVDDQDAAARSRRRRRRCRRRCRRGPTIRSLRCAGEQRGGHLGRASHQQRIGVGESGRQLGGGAAASGIDLPSGFGAEQVERRFWQVVGDHDFHSGMRSVCGHRVLKDVSARISIARGALQYNPEVLFVRSEWRVALLWCKSLKHSGCSSQRGKRTCFSTEFSTASVRIALRVRGN